ncbi:MAG TPA: hypothetical protein VFK38_06595, partial [Candidatus Limnocylindrales bacterium]|nr:hypothetical protein [Candidatus Limnocylindrales bacterium]
IGAVGLAFALRGAAPTASAPATTLAASPPSVSGSPTAEPFPNTAERRLMQRLPPTIGRDCQRINGRSGDPASGLFTAQMSETNLRCAPTASNPEAVRVYEFRNVDTRLGSPKTVLFWEGGNRGIFQSGACATDERALQEWRTGGERAGYLLCYVEKGKANLWWTHDASRILIWAVARDADRKALWEWWLRTGPFLGL